jgi:predicted CxxxxCH...CXXCH cytochrome family protein
MIRNTLLLAGVAIAAAACTQSRDIAAMESASQCGSCHGYPPPPGVTAGGAQHPQDTRCHLCHLNTVDANEALIPGGAHQNGTIDVVAHPDGFSNPTLHGKAALGALASCPRCHGADYGGAAGGAIPSCNACHAQALPGDWKTNCTFCHGAQTPDYTADRLARAAPPRGVNGETATTDLAVGAHQAHLAAGAACNQCHSVPTDLSHVDGGAPSVRFGALATTGSASWDPATATCSSVYCHGGTLNAAGSLTAPRWTKVDGTQAACGTCHGVPPPAPHPSAALGECGACHPEVSADANGNLLLGSTHIDGQVELLSGHPSGWADPTVHGYAALSNLSGCTACHGADYGGLGSAPSCNACHAQAVAGDWKTNCSFCHGGQLPDYTPASLAQAAPPKGVHGETAQTSPAVGAHQAHLQVGAYSAGVACVSCHTVPADLAHVDGGAAPVTLGGVAATGGFASSYSASAGTCTTYCHGATLQGGSVPAPQWTSTAALACDACHGVPPDTGKHYVHVLQQTVNPFAARCYACHEDDAVDQATPALAPAGLSFHVNGRKDVNLSLVNGTWDPAANTCAVGCHDPRSWY